MIDFLKQKFSKENSEEDESRLEENLQFLEEVLSEEDPDFMKSVGEISIDNAEIHDPLIAESISVQSNSSFSHFLLSAKLFRYLPMSFLMALAKPFQFRRYPKQAAGFWLVTIGLIFTVFLFNRSQILSSKSQLFLTSYADWGLKVQSYDMLTQVEPYFDNARFSKNVMSLIKMTANIRPSESSSDNPMVSFEIVLQGVSSDAIVEIKDREAEFRDLVLRVTEEFSYDELDTVLGKQRLSEALLAKINSQLSDGHIRKVYYNNFVIKP